MKSTQSNVLYKKNDLYPFVTPEKLKVRKAIENDDADTLRQLVNDGIDLSYIVNIKHALEIAAENNKLKVLKYLVEELRIVAKIDSAGKDAITAAIKRESLEAFQYLLKMGVDIETQMPYETLLLYAARVGYSKFIKLLIENGAEVQVQVKNLYNLTPLHYMALHKDLENAVLLIKNGADCNINLSTPPDHQIYKYLKLGSFVQSLCSGLPAVHGTDDAIKEMLARSPEGGPMLEFAAIAMKNYALKTVASSDCLEKIKTCDFLPGEFRAGLLNKIYPIFNDTQERLEFLDAAILCSIKVTDNQMTLREANALISEPDFFEDTDIFQEVKNTYELFVNHEIKGFCAIHFANTSLAANLSVLAGFMICNENVKESVELVLTKSIPLDVRKSLTNALKQCNDSKLDKEEVEELILNHQLSSTETFYPEFKAVENHSKAILPEINLNAEPEVETTGNLNQLKEDDISLD